MKSMTCLGTDIEEEDMDTIGGWILTQNFDIQQGKSVSFNNYEFKVIDMEEHHIKRVEVFKKKNEPSLLEAVEVV